MLLISSSFHFARIAAPLILALLVGSLSLDPSPLRGPGGVLEAQQRLFAALDAGDAGRLDEFVPRENSPYAPRVSLALVDALGRPLAARGREQVSAMFAQCSADWSASPAVTTVSEQDADCPTEGLGWAVSRVVRRAPGEASGVELHSSLLLRHEDGAWRVLRWHLSPAVAPPARAR